MSSSTTVKKSTMTVGGKLKFKGSKSTTSKKIQKIDNDGCSKLMMASNIADQKSEKSNISISDNGDKKSLIFMTDAQKRHQEKRMAVEEKELKKFIKTTHRDRIESFNARLGSMTEHNDIPRISAAGNG